MGRLTNAAGELLSDTEIFGEGFVPAKEKESEFELVRGACLMLKKDITGVAEGRREPIVISVEGDTINCMEGDGSDKPMSLTRAEVVEFYDIADVLPEELMEENGY